MLFLRNVIGLKTHYINSQTASIFEHAAVSYSTFKELDKNPQKAVQDLPKQEESVDENVMKRGKFPNLFEAFASKENRLIDLHRYNPMSLTSQRLNDWLYRTIKNSEIFNQRFIQERHDILGCDLATAHFIVFRNGKVRFKGSDLWIEKPEDAVECTDLPNKFVRNLYLEAIDASNTKIRYEGLDNFSNLKQLKWLSFKNCENVDDWFVDRLSGEFYETLEYLDLSDCFKITENVLSCFYRFKNLKTLVLCNLVRTKKFEFSCMLLEDAFPELVIDNRNLENLMN